MTFSDSTFFLMWINHIEKCGGVFLAKPPLLCRRSSNMRFGYVQYEQLGFLYRA